MNNDKADISSIDGSKLCQIINYDSAGGEIKLLHRYGNSTSGSYVDYDANIDLIVNSNNEPTFRFRGGKLDSNGNRLNYTTIVKSLNNDTAIDLDDFYNNSNLRSVRVTSDGVKTYSQLIMSLYSQINPRVYYYKDSYLVVGNDVYMSIHLTQFRYSLSTINHNSPYIRTFVVSGNSATCMVLSDGVATYINDEVPAKDINFTIYYRAGAV